ncbi:unnamed protein product [Lymnaea stagnalis]|uniref:TrmE-type G domain-containing protein n=1 Tax=Lymnaea stagnalis TaxID=6523 RepID=A0AAV2I3W9_LYMST
MFQFQRTMGLAKTIITFTKNIRKVRHFRYFTSYRPNNSHTIFALSSGSGKCGVAVIRISGPKAKLAIERIVGDKANIKLKPRTAALLKLYEPNTQEMLDKALVLWFPGPHSFTGEDIVEFHVHGGSAVISSVLTALGSIAGLKPAQPGEFAKQAFVNGKLDLTEVEGLGDLIHAETEVQRRQALRQMGGELGQIYSQWRTRLIKCLANTEAFIDFHEEENIEDDILDSVIAEISKIKNEVSAHLQDCRHGERRRDGLHVVIIGEPNVGKSSLLNAICQRPAAIVSTIAGTTRDVVETALNIAGYPVLLSDTAGLQNTSDVVEKEGILRAMARATAADLKIIVLDISKHANILLTSPSFENFIASYMGCLGVLQDQIDDSNISKSAPGFFSQLKSENQKTIFKTAGETDTYITFFKSFEEQSSISKKLRTFDLSNILIVVNKSDMVADNKILDFIQAHSDVMCRISCKSGDGFDSFMKKLVERIQNLCGNPTVGSPSLTQARHRHHLNKCQQYLTEFPPYLQNDVVMAAEKLRLAVRELANITGAVSTEDVLDVIFRDFCIGK